MFVMGTALLISGCGQNLGGFSAERELTLGYIEWDENVAVSNLTKVVMEEDLGYSAVDLRLADLGPVFQEVGSGDLAAFQDVWMPNHTNFLERVENEVEHLDPWYLGETSYGIAVPDYMDVQSLEDLDAADTSLIIGIEPGAAFHPQIKDVVIPEYDLDMKLVESSTPAMLSQLENAYGEQEPVVFLRWEPHWMNAKYDLRYLDDPRDAQGEFNEPAKISTIVHKDLPQDDPVAYEFLKAIRLDAEQVNQMELEINNAGDPVEGVKVWLENNREVVEPWVEAAEQAQ